MKLILVAFFSLVLGIAVGLYWPDAVVPETAAPEVRLSDGDLMLERKPGTARKVTTIPKGTTREREISVSVSSSVAGCPACEVALTLVREKTGAHRVIASSSTGLILTGLDVPVDVAFVRPRGPWIAGALGGKVLGETAAGLFVGRDVGPLWLGVDVGATESGGFYLGRVGWRF